MEDSKGCSFGRVAAEDEKDGKRICEKITPFQEMPKELCIQFASKEEYAEREEELLRLCSESDGNDSVVIYIRNPKQRKVLPPSRNVCANEMLVGKLASVFGEENVKVV